jgi:hypothetical protein
MKRDLWHYLLCFLLLLFPASIMGQSAEHFKKLILENDSIRSVANIRVNEYCIRNGVKNRFERNGITYIITDISPSGLPLLDKTYNTGLASTLGIPQVRSGGSLGVNLTGTEMKVGIWDGGRANASHVELTGRISVGDGSSTTDTHATHVTGTILAKGMNTLAMGMAPDAEAISFDFDNDVSEMLGQAKADQTTLLLSNHSYGTVAGWEQESNGSWTWYGETSVSSVEDYKFGYYDAKARSFDQLTFNAPYYSVVKAAGNDRSDSGDGSRPPDGPFNSIATYGNAKNVITVGAVSKLASPYTGPSSVQMASFSGWGPTDDGRIKPDFVAPGVNVFSTSALSNESYTTLSGTSMSTPAATGGFVLLQQLYHQLTDNYMRSATLKALAIHTTKEAGPQNGPDYQFGWGLLDIGNAAKVILTGDGLNTQIIESTLVNNNVFTIELHPEENAKITATLAWTDPAGVSPPVSLNPSNLMLVNDLDLRIVDEVGSQQFPWVLNPASPSNAATRADNFRDNVEKIEFAQPLPRKYFLKVSHKGNLVNGLQNFSLILTYTSSLDSRTTLYWIGGDGNWDDGSHWSLSSGGTPANQIPTSADRVVIDENSTNAVNTTINLNSAGACFSLSVFSTSPIVFNMAGNSLAIHEDILINSSNLTTTAGIFHFAGADGDFSINSNSQLENLTLQFTGLNSIWDINKNINVSKLLIEQGNLKAAGRNFSVGEIEGVGTGSKTLDISGSTITVLPGAQFNFSGINLKSDVNSTLRVNSGIVSTILLNNNSFKGTILMESGGVSLESNSDINRIFGKGSIHFTSDLAVKTLDLEGGSSITIQDNTTLSLTEKFQLNTTPGNLVSISNSNNQRGGIEIFGNHKICHDYLTVNMIDYTGEAVLNAGVNSSVINSSGWLQQPCGDILFSDFDVQYACKESFLYLTNASEGSVTSYKWFLNNTLVSEEEDFIVKLTNEDAVTIKLQVQNGTTSDVYEENIQITENSLPTNYLVLSNDKLVSFIASPTYQWILDGELLQNESNRSIVYTGAPGMYSVLIFNGNCNRSSEPFIISGFDSPQPNYQSRPFPNPTREYVNFISSEEIVQFFAIDTSGKRIPLEFSDDGEVYQVDMRALQGGVFYVKAVTKEMSSINVGRVIKY